jgi:MFS family permease
MTQATPEPFRIRSLGMSVYLPALLFAIGQGAVIPVIPLYAMDLGASVAVAGLIVSLRGFGTMFFDIPAGILVSRFGERWAMVIGTAALASVAVGAALSQSLWVFAGLIFVMGCAWSLWLLARLSYVSERAPAEVRGRALSLLGGTNRIGNFVGPVAGGLVGSAFGLQTAFYVQAALAILASAVLFVLVRDEGGEAPAHAEHAVARFLGVVSEHRRVFATAGIATLAIQVLRNARQAVLPLWGDQIGLGAAEIGLIFGASGAIDMLVFYPVGMVMDHWGRKWAGVPSLVLMAIGLLLVPLTYSFVPLMLVALVGGLGNGLGSGIVMTLGADFSPAVGRGEFLGVWRLIGDIGTSAGPAVVGLVAGVTSLGMASVAAGCFGFAGALVMIFLVEEPLRLAKRRRR